MASILIAENDRSLATIISRHFARFSHSCKATNTVSDAIDSLEKKNYDLLILDRMLDDGDSLEIANYIADIKTNTKVIFLSDLGTTRDRITGLTAGSDDYLAKPFSLEELSLKAHKLLSVTKIYHTELGYKNLRLNESTGEVFFNDKLKTVLRKKEVQILAILVRQSRQIVSREQIINTVWGTVSNIPTYSTIDAYIRKIRMRLSTSEITIKTHRGFGYRLT